MQLNISFGLNLNGFLYPAGTNSLDEARFGENDFLNFLEERAGMVLTASPVTAERIAAAQMAMLTIKNSFYKDSFDIDPWSSAKTFLKWRDSLIMGGWNGDTDFPESPRLHTIYRLEKSDFSFKNGLADRLRAVLSALPDADTSDIEKILLTTPYDLLPRLWQRILDILKDKKNVPYVDADLPDNTPEILVLSANNDLTAAEVIAERLALADKKDGDIVLIGKDNAALNNALKKRNLPALESNTASAHRSILQVFPCLIEIMEKPLRIQKLYNFLRLPKTPITGGRKLAKILEKLPGIKNEEWNKKLTELKEEYEDTDQDYWLGLAEKYEDGIPNTDLNDLIDKLEEWLDEQKGKLVSAAKEQLKVFRSVLETFSIKPPYTVSFIQLRKILDSICTDAENPYEEERSVSPWLSVCDPAKILGSPETAIWYDFRNDAFLSAIYPWTIEEEKILHDNNVFPVTNEDLAKRAALEWKNALRAERLIISVPKTDRGKEFEIHPFYDEIKAKAKTVDASLSEKEIDLFGKKVKINKSDIPEKTDNSLSFDEIKGTPASTSEMETLINCPLKWYYQYQLGLGDHLPSLKAEPLAIGSLAHKVVELLTKADKEWPLWEQKKLKNKTKELFDDTVAKQAAFLSEKGREQEKENVGETVLEAVLKLKAFITENDLKIVGSEVKFGPNEKKWKFGQFTGFIDLLLKQKNNKNLVLDMKFSRKNDYEENLKNEEAAQLALYGNVVGGKTAGYFLMKSNRIVMNAEMEEAEPVEADLSETWKNVLKQVKEKMDELKKGKFDPKWNKDLCPYCGYGYLCGVQKKDDDND